MEVIHGVLDPENPVSDKAMIALLPITTEWCKIDLPHLTLVYAGAIADMNPTDFNELAKDASSIAMLSGSIQLRSLGVEVFGDTDKVNVLKFQPSSELWAMRRAVESWDTGEFPIFKPHCTVGPVGAPVEFTPSAVAFDRIMAAFGGETLTFWLKGCGTRPSAY